MPIKYKIIDIVLVFGGILSLATGLLLALSEHRIIVEILAILLSLFFFNIGFSCLYLRSNILTIHSANINELNIFLKRLFLYSSIFVVFKMLTIFLEKTSGVFLILGGILLGLSFIMLVRAVIDLSALCFRTKVKLTLIDNIAFIFVAIMLVFVLFEIFLQVYVKTTPVKNNPQNILVMPKQWECRNVKIPGAVTAYYWHGKLQVFNKDSFRYAGEFPAKKANTCRIVIAGDSLTYGYGIAREETYPYLIEQALKNTYRVEVINLGRCGAQSNDVYDILEKYIPILQPDLVIYGAYLNDFTPTEMGQYANNYALQLPIPYKLIFMNRTLTGKFLAERYNDLLMKLGIRADFYTDILRDFNGYQERFAKDVKNIVLLCKKYSLPKPITMVLEQYPDTQGKGYKIILVEEKLLTQAGLEVITAIPYIKANDGRKDLYVSRWEGHPNAAANKIFATEFLKVLTKNSTIKKYKRDQ
jgi:hypothetical protein